ncbi:hypothetical protein YSA_02360 [Pseudomonas putida ND6]|uniref:Uncharacterized protein n=1 Tax=Pseudomonas putida ND6 TaxID=231023 RepID=I3URC4_PSEPU|nr:hypothetical protein YSA_02360 [Pseudomonas putida ND6]
MPAHQHALVVGIDYYRILGGMETILRRKRAQLTVAIGGVKRVSSWPLEW